MAATFRRCADLTKTLADKGVFFSLVRIPEISEKRLDKITEICYNKNAACIRF
jgi:hypothetical protein